MLQTNKKNYQHIYVMQIDSIHLILEIPWVILVLGRMANV